MTFRPTLRMSRLHTAALLLGAAALTACSADNLVRPEGATPAKIVVSSSSAAALASLGDTALVTARVLDRAGNSVSGATVRWSLDRAGVVQQDADGVYRAVGNGRVTVVAEVALGETGVRPAGYWADRVADSVVVEVRQRPARITLAPVDTAFATLGALRPLRAQVTDARGNALLDGPPPLAWSTENAGVLSVDGVGVVRSLGEGTARVTVRADALAAATVFTVQPRLPHTACMQFTQRRQSHQSCVTVDLVLHERAAEGAR